MVSYSSIFCMASPCCGRERPHYPSVNTGYHEKRSKSNIMFSLQSCSFVKSYCLQRSVNTANFFSISTSILNDLLQHFLRFRRNLVSFNSFFKVSSWIPKISARFLHFSPSVDSTGVAYIFGLRSPLKMQLYGVRENR